MGLGKESIPWVNSTNRPRFQNLFWASSFTSLAMLQSIFLPVLIDHLFISMAFPESHGKTVVFIVVAAKTMTSYKG